MQNITGPRIKHIRRDCGLTQAELAARLQLAGYAYSRTTIAKIETGIRQITDIELQQLAHALGVPVARFFEDTSDEDT